MQKEIATVTNVIIKGDDSLAQTSTIAADINDKLTNKKKYPCSKCDQSFALKVDLKVTFFFFIVIFEVFI